MGIGNKQQNEEVSLLHPEHLSSVTKLTLLAMASIALSGYYRVLDYGAWPEGEAGCFLIQVAIKKKKKLFTGKKIGELKPSRNLARVIPHLSAWWHGRGSALSRLGAELELRRSGSSLGPSQ